MEGADPTDDFERLFLLEFLVNSVHYSNSTMRLDKNFLASLGQTCVQIKFLSYPMMEICEEDFCPGQEPYEDTNVVFKSGKSCLFSLKRTQCVPNCMNICITVVRKKEGGCGEDFCMGTASINLGSSFTNLFNMQSSNTPLCKSLKETYCLVNAHKETIGNISLFIRLSCFGKMIVTQFQVGAADQSYMFKASSDIKASPPCAGDTLSTPVIHQGMPAGAPSYGVDTGMTPMFGMGAPGMGMQGMGMQGMGMQGMGMQGMGMQGMGMQGMGMQGMGMQGAAGMQGMGMPGMGMQGMGMPGMGMQGMGMQGSPGMGTQGMSTLGMGMQGMGMGIQDKGIQGIGVGRMDPSQPFLQEEAASKKCSKRKTPAPPPYPFCQRVTIGDTESDSDEQPQAPQLNFCDCDYPIPPGLHPPPPPPKKKKKKVCCPLEPQPGDYCLRADCPCGYPQPPWMAQDGNTEPMAMEKFDLSPGAVGFKGKQVIFQMNDKKASPMSNDARKVVENTQYKVGCQDTGKGQRNVIQVIPDPVECVPPPDPDRDIFILKVGRKNEANEKAKMEIELKSPKYKDNTPQMVEVDTQWLATDVQPPDAGKRGEGKGKGGKGGKGKGKGGKGKGKGKKK